MRCEPSTGLFLSVVTDGVLSLQASLRNLLAAARSIRRFCCSSSAFCFEMRSVGGVEMGRASGMETDAAFSSALSTGLRLSCVCTIKVLTPAAVAAAFAAARVAAAARFSWCSTFWRVSKANAVFFASA